MVWHATRKTTDKEIEQIFKEVKKRKRGVNVQKYAGKIKVKGNPVLIQRKLRDEWQ